ncbi:helicase-associated domain-containing protein [Tsukamurella sp. 8F]|uniref:helicase-associated domain-containing protein n=1 Tax=unclassified Tsukamurella TaxID=2633480 RepID=UPI0023B9C261|nr:MULTISPECIES: helicase-associated domain-containing protein [unclassified Tsukamurella]MDF0529839.1 helicase-associated domain-containing protein [Tsukamurella sp. 8J]MDF0587031.1 helicase-associated domain-containing protein [Tsukamurella sp. 8F]
MTSPTPDDPVAGLAVWLGGRPDRELTQLLGERRDVATPPPPTLTVLASRLSAGPSIARAAEDLDLPAMAVIEVLVAQRATQEPVPAEAVYTALAGRITKAGITARIRRLRALALAWGPDGALRVAPTVREALPWRTPQLTGQLHTVAELRELLDTCSEAETALLHRLAAGNPIGRSTAAGDTAPADHPVQRLFAKGLLARVDELTVELPAAVGALLRGDDPADPWQLRPPALDGPVVADVDAAGASEALELLRHAEAVIELLGAVPAPTLRSGGIGILQLRRIAKATGLEEGRAALVLELLAEADLIAAGDVGEEVAVAPTSGVDGWLAAPAPDRWADLALAWLRMRRRPSAIGTRTDDGVIGPLSAGARSTVAPLDRRAVLGTLAKADTGVAPPVTALQNAARYAHPRWQRRLTRASIEHILGEAAAVGLVARGALSGIGRAARDGDSRAAVAGVAAAALPEPVEEFLLQADLTLTVPGPMAHDFAAVVTLVANLESAGGASVYRVTEGSLRRALDAGRAAAELHAFFAAHSATPVPQTLTYLIDDVARRHGQLRAGVASSFVRSDDPALITAVASAPVAVDLALRVIAPTVAISQAPLADVVAALRQAGYPAAAENAAGAVVDLRPAPARVPPPRPRPTGPAGPTPESLASAVARIREREAEPRSDPDGEVRGAEAVLLLENAKLTGRAVVLGYVDANGTRSLQRVRPQGQRNGRVLVRDERGLEREFSLHRITGVRYT